MTNPSMVVGDTLHEVLAQVEAIMPVYRSEHVVIRVHHQVFTGMWTATVVELSPEIDRLFGQAQRQ